MYRGDGGKRKPANNEENSAASTESSQPPSKRARPSSPERSMAPDVNSLLPEGLATALLFGPGSRLFFVFSNVFKNADWARRLDPRFKDLSECEKAVSDNEEMLKIIEECTKSG